MTIFRSSIAAIALIFCVSCEETTNEIGDSVAQDADSPPYRALVYRDGAYIELGALAKEFRDNPNRFEIENQGRIFNIKAKIREVPKFDEFGNEIVGFYLPLIVREYRDPSDAYFDQIGSAPAIIDNLSIYLNDFSISRAAELDKGQMIEAKCSEVSVQSLDVSFDDCDMVN